MSTVAPQVTTPSDVPSGAPAPPKVPTIENVDDLIHLPRGRELTEVAAAALAVSRPVRLIVFTGPVDTGKTTLLTSLYEMFQWGHVSGYRFAGSATLRAVSSDATSGARLRRDRRPRHSAMPLKSFSRSIFICE